MSKHPYIHIINEKISQSNKLHPFNDKKITKLTDKTRYIECFTKDISNGIVTYLLGDDDYCFKDISKKGKKNLFNFHLPNGQDYNIFVDHPDGGGKDISFNDSSKKVLIPYDNVSFRLLIKEMKNVLVLNIYYMLIKNESNELLPDFSKYVYLVVIPSEIYTSEVVYNILYDVKKSNGSSRWVTLQDIKKCWDTKLTGLNKEGNVWIVHPENISDFLASVVIDDYRNQFQRAYIKLLEIAYFNKKYSIRQKQITKKRAELRNKLLNRLDECQIKKCKIKQKACLVASHIWAVNKILSEQGIKWDKKIQYIGDENNAFLLCNLHDKLFDRYLISFDDNGGLIISKLLKDNIHAYGLKDKEIYLSSIKEENRFYLHKHRKVFKEYESKRFSQFTS